MPRMATGRLSPRSRSFPAMEAIGLSRRTRLALGRDNSKGGRPGWCALALLGVWFLRVLFDGRWETVCAQAQFGGYTRNGGFAFDISSQTRTTSPTYLPDYLFCGCRPIDLCWHHYLQGDQADRSKTRRMDRHFGNWRTRASGGPICEGHRDCSTSARSTSMTASLLTPSESVPIS